MESETNAPGGAPKSKRASVVAAAAAAAAADAVKMKAVIDDDPLDTFSFFNPANQPSTVNEITLEAAAARSRQTISGGVDSPKEQEVASKMVEEEEEEEPEEPEEDWEEMAAKHTEQRELFEELDDLFETAASTVEAQCRVDPLRFLGAIGSYNLLGSYCFCWAAVLGVTLSIAGVQYDPRGGD